jgi:hypothetical protein
MVTKSAFDSLSANRAASVGGVFFTCYNSIQHSPSRSAA